MKKRNKETKKGFTLVELLAVIAIISLVLGISYTIFSKIINNSTKKSNTLAKTNILKTAADYTKEYDDIAWLPTSDDNSKEYSCIPIQELINKGYFDEKDISEEYKDKNIIVTKDLNNQTIENEEIDNSNKCERFIKIDEPTCKKDLIYNGNEQELLNLNNNDYKIVSVNTQTDAGTYKTDAGTYKIEVSLLNDDTNDNEIKVWKNNGRTNNITVSCTIKKAKTTIELEPTLNEEANQTKYTTKATPHLENKNLEETEKNNNKNFNGNINIVSSNKEYVSTPKNLENIKIGEPQEIEMTAISQRDKTTTIKFTFIPDNNNYDKSSKTYYLTGNDNNTVYKVMLDSNCNNCFINTSYQKEFQVLKNNKYGEYLVNNLDRDGYNFQGWFTDDGTKKEQDDKVTSNHTLYAQWKIKTYTINYNANGGSNAPSAQIKEYGKNLQLSSTKPTRNGYTFTGWRTSTGKTYSPGDNYTANENVTLYAVWNAITYTVTLNKNNCGGNTEYIYYKYNTAKNINNTYYYYYSDNNLTNAISKVTPPSKTGYTFKGYYTNNNGTGTNYIKNDGTFINNMYTTIGNKTLYAKCDANTYTITYNSNGGNACSPTTKSVTYASTYGDLCTPTRTGYTFAGWYTAASGGSQITSSSTVSITSKQTLYAHWTANKYTITYNSNGGNACSPTTKSVTYASTYGDLCTPTRTGYTFAGWYTAASGGSQITSSSTVSITSKQTLYAHWTANKYTITYNSNGGNACSPTTKSVTYASTYGDLCTPTRTDYTFAGWYTAASGGSKITSSTTVSITSKQTLYAHWNTNYTTDVVNLRKYTSKCYSSDSSPYFGVVNIYVTKAYDCTCTYGKDSGNYKSHTYKDETLAYHPLDTSGTSAIGDCNNKSITYIFYKNSTNGRTARANQDNTYIKKVNTHAFSSSGYHQNWYWYIKARPDGGKSKPEFTSNWFYSFDSSHYGKFSKSTYDTVDKACENACQKSH